MTMAVTPRWFAPFLVANSGLAGAQEVRPAKSRGRPCSSGRRASQIFCSSLDSIDVYVGTLRLIVSPGPARWATQAAYAAGLAGDLLHYITILHPRTLGSPCTVMDFQPQNPEDPLVAVAALMGHGIPGVVQERTIPKLQVKNCWRVGTTKPERNLESAQEFNRGWCCELVLGVHDCRHYTLALVEYLTGKSNVLSDIKELRSIAKTLT
ncbi:unnamed protein product [Sphagnum troendelagicum]|uniref:Uncharacterized protein n=1 Tax=Sphagnum troendelagicum TaxID=128251 RepID=A0ABP0UF97_9BRYO